MVVFQTHGVFYFTRERIVIFVDRAPLHCPKNTMRTFASEALKHFPKKGLRLRNLILKYAIFAIILFCLCFPDSKISYIRINQSKNPFIVIFVQEDAFYQDVVLVIVDSVASLVSSILGGHGT